MADYDYNSLQIVGLKDPATGTVQFGIEVEGGFVILTTLKQGYVDGRIAAAAKAAEAEKSAKPSDG